MRNLKFEVARAQETYEDMHRNMNSKDYFQEIKKQFPKKRVSCFADLEFTIRYGKLLLKEVLHQPKQQDEWNLWVVMAKWVNFPKFMSFEEQPTLTKVTKEVSDAHVWIKEQL